MTAATGAEGRPTAPSVEHQILERFMQVHNSYLVAQSDDGLIIIDQHALHERIIYEQLQQKLKEGPLPSQRCLIPETICVSGEQMAALDGAAELLAELGIIVEPFGPRTLAIQGFPARLDKVPPAEFVADLLDLLAGQAGQVSHEELLHCVLDMTACKAAVKAGDPLNAAEIESLLEQRNMVERAGNCPHGRPTTIRLSLAQLEKQFKRT
jgi:DNA mismatch repair protein MutL